jgi:proprotein convertase subtilisin/kexin type 5
LNSEEKNIDFNSWVLITMTYEASASNGVYNVWLENELLGTRNIPHFLDTKQPIVILRLNNNFYQGWIYRIQYLAYLLETNQYLNIRADIEIWTCSLSMMDVSGECKPCLSQCSTCRYVDTCTLCSSPNCAACDNFSSYCSRCIEKGDINTHNCSCLQGYARNKDKCESCHNSCTSCTTITHLGCSTCKFNLNQKCTSVCPYLYTEQNPDCLSIGHQKFNIDFNRFLTSTTKLNTDILSDFFNIIQTSPVAQATPSQIFGYKRGLYLKTLYLESIIPLLLSNIFSIKSWVHPYTTGVFLYKPKLGIEITDINVIIKIVLEGGVEKQVNQNKACLNTWNLLTLTVDIDGDNVKISLFLNEERQDTSFPGSFLDIDGNLMISTATSTLRSWVYSFTYSITSLENNDDFLSIILTLWPCFPEEYYEGNTCKKCMLTCLTCRYSDTCSLCSNILCDSCDSFDSTSCKKCSPEATYAESNCVCPEGKVNFGSKCLPCHPACKTCNDASYSSCTSCYITLNHFCTVKCPLFYKQVDTSCIASEMTSARIIFNQLDGIFQTENPDLSFISASKEPPLIGYLRGVYFNGSQLTGPEFSMFSNIFSISMWINSRSLGRVLEKPSFFIETSRKKLSISITLQNQVFSFSLNNNFNIDTWSFLFVSVKSEQGQPLTISIRQDTFFSEEKVNDYYLDWPSSFSIGSGIIGWIYSFNYWSEAVNFNDLSDVLMIGSFLWNCRPFYYFNGKSCSACPNLCNCRRPNDCRPCNDEYCDVCSNSESTCLRCMEKSIWVEESGKCARCLPRYEGCSYLMESDQNCIRPFFKNYDGTCLSYCGDGDLSDDWKCNRNDVRVFSFTFNRVSNVITSGKYQMYMGLDDSFWPKYDNLDPFLLYKRGLYFNRSSATLGTPQKPSTLRVSNTHTFELFLNPLNPGQLLSLSDEKFPFISLSHQITSKSPQLFLSYMITDTFSSSNLNHSSPITPGLWYHFRWSLDFTSNKLTLRTYLNNEEIEIKAEINSIFNQPLTSYFFLGGRIVSSFTGYIYRVSFFNFLVNNFDPLDSCSGSECLEMNEFLSSCLFNEFPGPQLRCGRCRVECLTGCSSEVNCNIHPDPLCKTFQFLNENCTQCVDGSVSKTFPCACAEGADYDIRSNSCRCPGIQKIYQDKCDNCTRWLQQGEVSGYFDNSFMQVIINFEVPVIKVPCKALFNESVIFKLGAGFSCIFSENLKVLTIVLGKGNTLKEETISFLEKSLIGTRQECGFNSTFVSVSLKFSAEFPTPKAIISVPDTILLNCQNLTVDGSLSTGKLLDDLQYQWEFVLNDKEIPELSKKGISIYPISRDLLEEGTILITLTVKNRFDYQDSTTSKVLLTTENKITVLFEQVNENSCKQSSPCQFSIKSIDTCSKNPLFNYSWKLKNQKEISADFDKFWALQTVPTSVKIPENFFLPGILKFELTVTETLSKAESISQLNVKILPSDLIISTDRIGGFVSSLEDLTISSLILNPLPENTNFQFTWECFLLGRPCKFQFTNNKSIVTIPRTFLQSQALDKLVLTVTLNYQLDQETSEFISSSLSLALKIVSWKVAKVQIVEALTSTEKRVFKISEKLTFKAIYEETDVFSFSWRVEGKDSIFITPTDQVYIGIDPSGLVQGESYKLVLEMTSESGSSSEYYYDFTMNSPPKFGIFSVTPNEGTELETEFYFLTNDWQDTEKNYPLLYNFGYIQENISFILIPTSISNSAKLILPYKGEKLTVFTKVFDSLGDYSEETLTVTIKKQDQSKIDEFLKKTSNSLNQVRFDLLPNVLSNILSASLNRRSDTETFPELDTKLQETLFLIQEKVSSLIELSMASPELIDLTSSLLQDLTQNPNLRSEENLNKTTQLIHQLLNQTDHLGLTKDQAENLLDSVDNSVKMKLSALYNQTASMDSLHQVLNNVNSGMMKKMIPGQKNQLETNQMTMQSLVFNDYTSGAQLKTEGLASVNVPSEVFQQMAGGLKIGMHFSTVKLDSTGESESVPDVLSISVFQEGLLKDVSLKTSKFLLEVPVVSVETVKKPACVFLNESYQWDSFGCTVVEVKTFSIICECSHLSFFSAGEGTEGGGFFPSNNFAQTTDFKSLKDLNATSALGFYVCGTLLVAYVIIAILVGSKDAEDMKEIIKQIDNQNVLKVVEAQEQSLHISQNDEAIMVDSDIAEGEMLDPKKEENIIIKARVRIKNLIHNHKFLRIFFLFDPNAFRLSTCTMIFTVLIGKMYFIGLFYDGGGGEEATTIREAISGYTFRDFLVMVYSTIIMFCIEVVVAYLTKNNPVNIKWSKDENVRIIKQNRWRRIGCLAFCWPLMIWFSWSIAMFAMNLDISVSYKWIVTTVTGYIGDFFFMPGFEYLLMKWIFPNLGVILQIRVCFYKCFEKRKKRKVESESMDELGSREGTEKQDIR